jgi:hypothetical protein
VKRKFEVHGQIKEGASSSIHQAVSGCASASAGCAAQLSTAAVSIRGFVPGPVDMKAAV